jgi:autotransporter-associated beta strand protein
VDGDPVTFDDAGSDTPAVNVTTSISTASVTASNGAKNYTIGGSGTINCSGGITKSGSGSLTLTGTSNFSSAIVVSGGTLALNGTTLVGSQLNLNAGTLAATLGGNNTFTGTLFANAGTQSMSGTNSFSGMVTTNAATTITGPTSITGTGGTNVYIGNLAGANASLTVQNGGTLNISGILNDAWVIGRDGGNGAIIQNGGTVTYNPSNRTDAYIGASQSGGTVASYDMNGGTLEMSNKRLGLAIGPITAHLTQTGGSINVRQLDLGSNLTSGTGIYDLAGGTMTVGAGGITSFSGNYSIRLGGGSIVAAEDWASPLTIELTGTNGATSIDTASHIVSLGGQLTGSGGLVKTGTGTLILVDFTSNFTGPTTVTAGTLAGVGNDASEVTVATGATLAPGVGGIGAFYSSKTTLAAGSTLALEIDSDFGIADQVSAVNSVSLSGSSISLTEVTGGILPLGTTFVIVDAPTRTGTFAGLPEGATISAGANTFAIHYVLGQVTLTSVAGSPYNSWAAAHGLDGTAGKNSAFNADPDNDGIANGLEWILGGNPLGQDSTSLVTSSGSAASGLTLNFTREESSLGNATLVVQWDSGLGGNWTSVPITQVGGPQANGVTVTVNEAATPDAVTVHIPASNAVGGKLFARVRATLP